jgi:hypothetical protein
MRLAVCFLAQGRGTQFHERKRQMPTAKSQIKQILFNPIVKMMLQPIFGPQKGIKWNTEDLAEPTGK